MTAVEQIRRAMVRLEGLPALILESSPTDVHAELARIRGDLEAAIAVIPRTRTPQPALRIAGTVQLHEKLREREDCEG